MDKNRRMANGNRKKPVTQIKTQVFQVTVEKGFCLGSEDVCCEGGACGGPDQKAVTMHNVAF